MTPRTPSSIHPVTLVFAASLGSSSPHHAEAHQDYTNKPQARLELFTAVMHSHAIQHRHPAPPPSDHSLQDTHHPPEALGFPGHLPQALLKCITIVFFPARYFSSIAANLSTGAEAATPSPCFRFPYPAANHNNHNSKKLPNVRQRVLE